MPMLVKILAAAGAVLLVASCATGASSGSADSSFPNTLTSFDKAAGWTLLFNGKDLTGWRGYKMANAPNHWTVEDGAITLTGPGQDLMTEGQYGPFELVLDWKIAPKGNSGIIYLVKETPDAANTYQTGPEMQVLDNDGHPDGKFPSHRAGALYDFVVPPEGAVKPVGEWNTAHILFTGKRLQQWLNGVKTVDVSYGDDAWRAAVAKTKFKTMPLFGTFASGHIALQDHGGDRVWYRNIKIRKL